MRARPASRGRGCEASGCGSGREQLVEAAVVRGCLQLGEPAEYHIPDEHLWKAEHARLAGQLGAADRILGEVDLAEVRAVRREDALYAGAERAGVGRVDGDPAHYFRKYSSGLGGGFSSNRHTLA